MTFNDTSAPPANPKAPITSFARMTEVELLAYCRRLYDEHGFEALTFRSLQSMGNLYVKLYQKGLTKTALIERLHLAVEYSQYESARAKVYAGKIREPWTWERVVSVASDLFEQHGHLPSSSWFQRHKLGAVSHYVYRSGRTWDQLQEAVGALAGGRFVESRNGLRWLSHAEASLSNYLYARGIEHKKGERYPASYTLISDAKYGLYDLHFRNKSGEWVDVEVWGDNPKGHQPEKYARRRKHKEVFNSDNLRFLGIPHQSCYDDVMLGIVLEPHIGIVEPFQFKKLVDKVIPSTHWSNADELLAYCRQVASEAPGGTFPTEDWLRKRGRWSERPGVAYNTLAVYAKLWLGGTRAVRRLLGQEHASTLQWDEESAIREYKRFTEQHAQTPGQVLGIEHDRGQGTIAPETLADATRVIGAVQKYAGGALAVQRRLGMVESRKYWNADSAASAYGEFSRIHGVTPSQAVGRWYDKSALALSEDLTGQARKILGAYKKHVGKVPRRGVYIDGSAAQGSD